VLFTNLTLVRLEIDMVVLVHVTPLSTLYAAPYVEPEPAYPIATQILFPYAMLKRLGHAEAVEIAGKADHVIPPSVLRAALLLVAPTAIKVLPFAAISLIWVDTIAVVRLLLVVHTGIGGRYRCEFIKKLIN
jgi:hypothetical protein